MMDTNEENDEPYGENNQGQGGLLSGWSIETMSSYFWADEKAQIDVAETYYDEMLVVKAPKSQVHFHCPKSLPHPEFWPDRPLLFRESSIHAGWNPDSLARPVPMGGMVHEFETSLFKGRVMMRLRNLDAASGYFEGKNRLSSCIISGQFKKDLSFADVLTGQEFCKPVKQPSSFVSAALVKFFRLLAPLLNVYIGRQSYMLSPLAQTAQVIHVSDDPIELEPGMLVEENLGKVQLGIDLPQMKRRKYFASKKNLDKPEATFRADKYYTFDFYNDKLEMENFQLRALGQSYDIQPYIKGQPLRVLSRIFAPGDPHDLYLWNFEIWHEKAMDYLNSNLDECCGG